MAKKVSWVIIIIIIIVLRFLSVLYHGLDGFPYILILTASCLCLTGDLDAFGVSNYPPPTFKTMAPPLAVSNEYRDIN